ncbi:Mob1/phocein [Penicillium italicum]|uniref:Mob1/phocein n=1 Tax=Penicillium italicum TaxID=40296 RepID=A0A0A2L9C9_PENIT|nr:Mob1/phocein [Penicillium italicum]
MTAAGVSPSSSPRLPSPPPFTEVQIGPQSPSVGESFGKDAGLLGGAVGENDGSTRRIRPGTKSSNMGLPGIPLEQIDSPFQLQEHLKAQYQKLAPHYTKLVEKYDVLMEKYGVLMREYNEQKRKASDKADPKYDKLMEEYNVLLEEYNKQNPEEFDKVDRMSDVAKEPTEPSEVEVAKEPRKPESEVVNELTKPPNGFEEPAWKYELCRFFTIEANRLVEGFLAESPPCSPQTCPEMRVNDWQYICAGAGHPGAKYCCAIDYCCHTLDWAMNILTSRTFDDRLILPNDDTIKKPLEDIFRRLYRFFAHAWFRHPAVFSKVGKHGGLYVFFKTVCVHYNLVKGYTIPLKAGGPDEVAAAQKLEEAEKRKEEAEGKAPKEKPFNNSNRFTILRKESENPFGTALESQDPALITSATTRRHKHSPSTGFRVTPIAEDAEDLEETTSLPLREPLRQSPEPRPVSVLEIRTREEPTATHEPPTDVVNPSEEPVEKSQEQRPQEPYEQPSETPEDQEKIEQVDQIEQTQPTKEPFSEEPATNTESPVKKDTAEDNEKTTSYEEATPAEEPKVGIEAGVEAAQEPSVASEIKDEPEKEES